MGAQGARDSDVAILAVARRFAVAWSGRDVRAVVELLDEEAEVYTGDRFVRAHERALIRGRGAIEAWLRSEWARGGTITAGDGFGVHGGVVSWMYGTRSELDRMAGLPVLEVTALMEVRDGRVVRFEPTAGTTAAQRATMEAALRVEAPAVGPRPVDTQRRTTPSPALVVGGIAAVLLVGGMSAFWRPAH